MNPDPPPRDESAPADPEALLRGLRFREIPSEWRAGILAAAVPPPLPPRWKRPYFLGMAAAWTAIALLRLTTPPLPDPPPVPPHPPSPVYPIPPLPPEEGGDSWLAATRPDRFPPYSHLTSP